MDFLFVIEHEDREGETCGVLASLLNEKGFTVAIISLRFHAHLLLVKFRPSVVVLPYAISSKTWPLNFFSTKYFANTVFISLNWEQLLSNANRKFKRPTGQMALERMRHLAWDSDFKEYLIDSGVPEPNITVIGNPLHELMRSAVAQLDKTTLRKALNVSHRKVFFFPMNLGWAFLSDRLVQGRVALGYDRTHAWEYQKHSKECFNAFLPFIYELAKSGDALVVVRPHPSVSVEIYAEKLRSEFGEIPWNLLVTKDRTVIEWVSISDFVCSSWSTVVWDAVNVGKRGALFVPKPIPSFLKTYWNDRVPHISTVSEFYDCLELPARRVSRTDLEVLAGLAAWLSRCASETVAPGTEFSTLNANIFLHFAKSVFDNLLMTYLKGRGVDRGFHRDFFKIREWRGD